MSRNIAAFETTAITILFLASCSSESAEQEGSKQEETAAELNLTAPQSPVGPRELESYLPADEEWPNGLEPDDVYSQETTFQASDFLNDPEDVEERVEGWMDAAEEQHSADAEGAQECMVALERWKADRLNALEADHERGEEVIEFADAIASLDGDDGVSVHVLLRSTDHIVIPNSELDVARQVACLPLGVLDGDASEEIGELELEGASAFWQVTGGEEPQAEVFLLATPGDGHHFFTIDAQSDDPDDIDELVQGVEDIYWKIQENITNAAD